jgi:hypothetical protein
MKLRSHGPGRYNVEPRAHPTMKAFVLMVTAVIVITALAALSTFGQH